jgi:UDP-glucose 4-epimerase
MNLNNVKKTYKPMLHGIGWLGDVKKIALRIDKIKSFFEPRLRSRDAVRVSAQKILEELL